MYSDINCPYCDKGLDINHDDGYGYEEDVLHQQYCSECSKYFTFNTSISYSYEAFKADCLNGQEHQYKPTNTYPKECTKMECSMCEDSRQPTPEERIKFDIPDYKFD